MRRRDRRALPACDRERPADITSSSAARTLCDRGAVRSSNLELLDWPGTEEQAFRYFGQGVRPAGAGRSRVARRPRRAGRLRLSSSLATDAPVAVLAEWRAQGTRIVVYQDRDSWPAQADRLIPAFEHAIDDVLVETAGEGGRLAALGIPGGKFIVLRHDRGMRSKTGTPAPSATLTLAGAGTRERPHDRHRRLSPACPASGLEHLWDRHAQDPETEAPSIGRSSTMVRGSRLCLRSGAPLRLAGAAGSGRCTVLG